MTTKPFIIDLKSDTKTVIRIGFAFTGFLLLVGVLGFCFIIFSIISDITVKAVVVIVACILFFYVARKYFQNVFYKEQISIDGDKLIITYKSWSFEKVYEFNLADIKYFGFVGMREYTEHPMNSSTVDFTGLGTGERELQFLIDDGTIEIETEDEVLRFGKNISSWNAEEVIEKIETHLGRKFINKYPSESIDEE